MFPDQVRRVIAARQERIDYRLTTRSVAQRYRDVAQPAEVSDASNRRAFGVAQKIFLAPSKQCHQGCRVESMAG